MTEKRQVTVKECDPIAIATLAVGAIAAYPAVKQIIRDIKGEE